MTGRMATSLPNLLPACFSLRHAHTAVIRSPVYATLRAEDLDCFRNIVGETAVVTDGAALKALNKDWMGRYEGNSRVALRPKTAEQVSKLLAHCNERRLAVVPQAGNTGLCGGSVPVFDEVILLTAGLNKVMSFDAVSGTLVCEAGCILEQLDRHVGEHGFTMPLDLGAKGSCQIGGNVSTNAGGLRLLRYGSLHGSVLGVEAVLADGTMLDLLQSNRKDNTGYSLKDLFVGGEGSLGVLTAISMLCPPKSSAVNVTFLACPDYEKLQKLFVKARQQLGEVLSAFEFLDSQALDLTLRELEGIKNPLPNVSAPFYLVVETSGSNAEHDSAKLEAFLDSAFEEELISDGTIAQSSQQSQEIWHLRESISVALSHKGPVYKYDLSLPVAELYGLVEATRERLKRFPDVEVVGYGHVGDGNLHLNVSLPEFSTEVLQMLEPFVYEYTAKNRGSISAEHGLGQMKNEYIGYSKPMEAVELMAKLKHLFDPNAILNPYKFLPQQEREHNEKLRRAIA